MSVWTRALVTGASSGIGEALAERLAARRTDLVVVARRADRLEALADRLRQKHNVVVEVLPADLADAKQRAYVEVRLSQDADPIDLLVNNAGFGSSGAFVDLPVETEHDQIEVNVVTLVRLTHAVLPGMIARRTGAVMNISSVAGLVPVPGNTVYGATKAFVTSFSEGLYEELRGTGVTVTAVLPGFTRTGFQQVANTGVRTETLPSFAWLDLDTVASAAVTATGRGDALCIPGLRYQVAAAVAHPVPRTIKRWIAGRVTRRFP